MPSPKRILALTRYTALAPSSRVRFFQFLPVLEQAGLEIDVAAFLGDEYVRRLYNQERQSPGDLLAAYSRRILSLLKRSSYDLLWIEKELLPWLPAGIDRLLAGSHASLVVDYDDAVFHRYDMHPNPFVRAVVGGKIRRLMRRASVVVVGNDYLADYARLAGAPRIEYLPSVVDTERYTPLKRDGTGFRVGWIGSPITAPYLGMISGALKRVLHETGGDLVLIGSGSNDPLPDLPKQVLPWSAASEVADLQSLDVGIMPLPDGPFERGKCGYKIIQYMACGLPVVASPVGANSRILEEGKIGFLASTDSEWERALAMLARDPLMRAHFGAVGRERVIQDYSLEKASARLLEIFSAAASS